MCLERDAITRLTTLPSYLSLSRMISPLCILFLCSFAVQASADLAADHSFFAPLDEDQNVKLYWNVSTANKEIIFTVEAKTTGWIGFGISSGQGKMKGADIVIGWVKDGKPYFKVGNTPSGSRKTPAEKVSARFPPLSRVRSCSNSGW